MTLTKQLSAENGNHELQLSEAPLPQPAARPTLTMKDVVAMIYRRRGLALALFVAIFAMVAAATIMQKSLYVVRAKLLFKKERATTVVSASGGAATEDKPQLSEEALNSEIEILQSTTLLREVLRENRSYADILGPEKTKALDSTEALELAVALFKADMNCIVVPKSNILQVTYEAYDPRQAAAIINELCQRYVERHLEIHESKGAYSFFQKQVETLQDSLQNLRVRLERYEIEHNLIAPDQQRQLYLQKLTEYEVQFNGLRASSRAATQQVNFLEKQIAAEPKRLQSQNQEVSSTVIDGLQDQLASLKAKYTEVVSTEKNRSEPKGQLARSLKARIAKIEESIQQHERTQQPEVATDINRSMMDLTVEWTRARFDMIGFQTKERELKTAAAELRQELKNLERASYAHEAMLRKLQLMQSNFELYTRKQEEARISEALDREKFANVTIIDPASVPLSPVSPNRKLNIMAGFFLALFISVGAVLGLGFFDGVVHASSDIERQLGVPVIVSIPEGEWPPNLLPETMFEAGSLPAKTK